MIGLQHSTGPASLADSLGWDAVGATWPVVKTWPSAAASQFAGDATGVWVGLVATTAAHGGSGSQSLHDQ
jgi:hypothetical protein